MVVATTAAVKAKADKRAARKGVRAAKLLPRMLGHWGGLLMYLGSCWNFLLTTSVSSADIIFLYFFHACLLRT